MLGKSFDLRLIRHCAIRAAMLPAPRSAHIAPVMLRSPHGKSSSAWEFQSASGAKKMIAPASSTGRRNTCVKFTRRSFET